jgi:phosphosulfolactate synthase
VFEPVERTRSPRAAGLTCVIDTGHGVGYLDDHLTLVADYVDLAKLGWGTSGVTPVLKEKLAAYRDHGIEACFGGTLFELCYLRGELVAYKRWLAELGLTTIEISDGTLEISMERKAALIADFARDFTVLSEVGSKDTTVVVAPARWVAAIRAELEAGSAWVILEGRESGTAGLYRESGEMRTGLVQEVLDSGIDADRLVFEAPHKAHQTYLIKLIGANVNLGNIQLHDVIGVETLRRGLRSDTLLHFHDAVDG